MHPQINFSRSISPKEHASVGKTRSMRKTGGMTLVELLVSTVLFAIMSIALLTTIVQSYRLAGQVRVQNEVRYVLRAMADQFSRTPYESSNPLFTITENPTGNGLSWRKDTGVFSLKPSGADDADYIDGTDSGLVVPLNSVAGTPVNVTFTCWIRGLNPTTGVATAASPSATPGGFMLRGDFTASFTIAGRALTRTVSIVRSVP